jgi:HEAT repeat protein
MLRGQLDIKDMNVQVTPGPALTISTAQMVSIEQSTSLPTDEAIKKAEQLIARLGAESYLDREKATEDLGKLGDSVMPVLKKHLQDKDPEVRQRILRVIEKLGGSGDASGNPQPVMMVQG